MTWQTIVSLVLMVAMTALGTIAAQDGGAEAPKWVTYALALVGAIGTAWRGIGVTGAAPPKSTEVPK